MPVRLQKIIAGAGLASRREAERMILAGRVRVNGKLVKELGTQIDPETEQVTLDGKPVAQAEEELYLALHKPHGMLVATSDEAGRPTVGDLLRDRGYGKGPRRVFYVGRLDFNSEGLLLLTNDGRLARALTHPSFEVERTYQVRVQGAVAEELLIRLLEGVRLEDGLARALSAEIVKENPRSTWIELVLTEGRNRLVRRMLESLRLRVVRLVRVAYGGVQLGSLAPGELRSLTVREVECLRSVLPE